MVNVIAWPPVGLTGWEITTVDPVSRSYSVLTGRRRVSAAQRSRRMATAIVPGRGLDAAGAGYVEMLKRQLQGGVNLVRVEAMSAVWHLAARDFARLTPLLTWTSGAVPMIWTSGGDPLLWAGGAGLYGVPASDGAWSAVTVTGLPPNRVVARPSERISITDGTDTEYSTVLTTARSDGTGTALVRLTDALTLSGLLSIGITESIVFEALEMPRAVQPVAGDWAYTWGFREVFADETGTWTEVDPWR